MADDQDPRARSNLRLLLILVIFAVAVVAMMFVTQELRKSAAMQDCLASGRTNCAPVSTSR